MKTLVKNVLNNNQVKALLNNATEVAKKARTSKIVVKLNSKYRATGFGQLALHSNGKIYYVPELWKLTQNKSVEQVALYRLNNANTSITSKDAIDQHNVEGTDLSYPIIVDQHLRILDGRHRWTKANRNDLAYVPVIVVNLKELNPIGTCSIFGMTMSKDALKRMITTHLFN